jgi:hypothetical protein
MKWIAVFAIATLSLPVCAQHTKGTCAQGPGYRTFNGETIEDDGMVGNPPQGWVGYTNTGGPISEMVIELQTIDKKEAVTAVTSDAAGRFTFPKLKGGTYYLIGTKKGFSTVRSLLNVSIRSKAIACLVTEAQ